MCVCKIKIKSDAKKTTDELWPSLDRVDWLDRLGGNKVSRQRMAVWRMIHVS